jgi:hypothetical protein
LKSDRCSHTLGRSGIGREREDQGVCERHSTIFAGVPTRKEILKIAVRKKRRKAFMLKALKETGTPRHAIAKGGREVCVEKRGQCSRNIQ